MHVTETMFNAYKN